MKTEKNICDHPKQTVQLLYGRLYYIEFKRHLEDKHDAITTKKGVVCNSRLFHLSTLL